MARVKTSSGKVLATALALSAVVHTVAIYPQSLDYASRPFRRAASALYDSYQSYKIRRDRQNLVDAARRQMRKGKLRLGEFILKGNEIDAREKGEKLDLEGAKKAYTAFEAALGYEISSGRSVPQAFPEAMKDMKYYGIPGGRMADALLERGGSCDQLSQLSSALVYDLGYQKQSFLRVYGANEDGLGHIAPIFRDKGKEYDVVSGGQSDGKGTLFPASYLVEAYAKAHGLPYSEAEDLDKREGKRTAVRAIGKHEISLPGGKPSGFSYPQAKDSFGGGAPLYSSRAFHAFSGQTPGNAGTGAGGAARGNAGSQGEKETDVPASIEFEPSLHIGIRSVAGVAESRDDEYMQAHVVELPTEAKLNSISEQIELGKKSLRELSDTDSWELAVRYGAISGLYRELEWNLRLLGKESLAEAAYEQRKKIAKLAEKPLSRLDSCKVLTTSQFDPNRDEHGYLVYLGRSGEDALFRALEKRPREEWVDGSRWNNCYAAAYLVANRSSRERTMKLLNGFSGEEKAYVLSVLKDVDMDGDEEQLRAIRLYSTVARTLKNATGEKREMIGGVVNQGEGLMVNDLNVVLEQLAVGEGTDAKVAIISVVDSQKRVLTKAKLREGETLTVSPGGRAPFDIRADKPPAGLKSKAETAYMRVFSGGADSFDGMVVNIRKECRENGIGKEWEDAIIAACAALKIAGDREFKTLNQYYQWIENKKGFGRMRTDLLRHMEFLKQQGLKNPQDWDGSQKIWKPVIVQ